MKKCCKCGKEVSDSSNFCLFCGQKFEEEKTGKEIVVERKELGKQKYIPLVCVLLYFVIGMCSSYVGIADFFRFYPMWWINLLIPALFVFMHKIPDKMINTVFLYIKHIARFAIYVELILSLVFLLYIQFHWPKILGDVLFWACDKIPAATLFSYIYYWVECVLNRYSSANLFWQSVSEMLVLNSYILAYYLSKKVLGEKKKISIPQFLKRHKKILIFMVAIMGLSIVKLLLSGSFHNNMQIQWNTLNANSSSCSKEMLNSDFEDSKVQIDDVIYVMDGTMSINEIFSKIEKSRMDYTTSHTLDSIVSEDETVNVIVYKDGIERFSFSVHNSRDEICTIKECDFAGFKLDRINDFSNIWYAYGLAADGSNFSYDNIESYFEGYPEESEAGNQESSINCINRSDELEYMLKIWSDNPLCRTEYEFYIDKSTSSGLRVKANSNTLFVRITMKD